MSAYLIVRATVDPGEGFADTVVFSRGEVRGSLGPAIGDGIGIRVAVSGAGRRIGIGVVSAVRGWRTGVGSFIGVVTATVSGR